MSKYTIRNRNNQINREDSGQFAITTAVDLHKHDAERQRRAEELKVEMSDFASRMGIDPDDLAGMFA